MPATGRKILNFNGPFKGINTLVGPTMIGPGDLVDAQNVFIKAGRIYPRPGYERKDSGTLASGIAKWLAMYAVNFLGTNSAFDFTRGEPLDSWMILQGDSTSAGNPTEFKIYQSGALNSASAVSPTTGTVGVKRGSFMQLGAWTVCCSGGDTIMVKVANDGSHTDREAGLPEPSNVPTVTNFANPTGKVSGAFLWKYTQYDATNGYESAPSPQSIHKLSVDVGVGLSNLSALSGGATRYRIYRRRVGSSAALTVIGNGDSIGDGIGAQDTFYLVGEYLGTVSHSSTFAAGSTTTVLRLNAGVAVATNDYYNNFYIIITGGARAGDVCRVTDYAATNFEATINITLGGAPAAGDAYSIVHDGATDEELTSPIPSNNFRPHSSTSFTSRDPVFCAYHRNRAFYAAYDNAVWYSETPDPKVDTTAFPSGIYVGDDSFFTIPTGDTEVITALWSYGRVLLVFTDRRVFSVDTDPLPDQDPVITEILGATGCISFWTIKSSPAAANEPGVLYYLSRHGIQRFDGSTSVNVGRVALENLWTTVLEWSHFAYANAFIDYDNLLYVCALLKSPSTPQLICLSIDTKDITIWSNGNSFMPTASCEVLENDDDEFHTTMFADFSTAKVYALDTKMRTKKYTDDGTNYAWSFTTGEINCGLPTKKKVFHNVRFLFDTAPASAVTVTAYLNGSGSSATSGTLTFPTAAPDREYGILNLGCTGDRIQLVLSGTMAGSTDLVPILGYSLEYQEVGS